MSITRERFEQGMSYDAFKAQMTRNQERFQANEQAFVLDPAETAVFANLPRPLDVLVLAEDWCGDVINNLPILGRLAAESGKLNLRIFLRDQNADIMDQYLNQGQFRSIPVFVFFDKQFNELGRFIERPASVTERNARNQRELYAQHPEFGSPDTPVSQLPEDLRAQVMQATAELREASKAANNQDVVSALRQIVKAAQA
ncbi:MAG TPA: thioredoxin family protein [Ktedonobacterales bacterium]|nr:thioredoxin family protein [Ktedonobacterales bacterium]